MTKLDLITEGTRKLEAYLKTGIEGFKAQAYDRLREGGIETKGCEHDPKHLLEHLRSWGY